MAGMMRFAAAVQTSNATAGQAALEIIAPSTRGFWLRSISAAVTNAVFAPYAVGRPAAKGITPTTPASLEALANDTTAPRKSLTQTATAWATPPTAPATLLGWIAVPGTIGASASYVPSVPIFVQPGFSIVLHNVAATTAATCVNVEIDELVD